MLSAHELFGFMSPALATEILDFLHESEKDVYRSTLHAVAETRKVRPVFLERKPRAERAKMIIESLSRPALEQVAGNVLRLWLVKKQTSLLVDFLNALAIKHDNGVVDDLPPTMDDAKLQGAVEGLLTKYPPQHVAVYLHAFYAMNETPWPRLQELLNNEPRLQF
jgi:hypothetical protein